jgi:hypothetical protein
VRAGLIGKVFFESYSQRGSPPDRLAPIDCIRIKPYVMIPIGPNLFIPRLPAQPPERRADDNKSVNRLNRVRIRRRNGEAL